MTPELQTFVSVFIATGSSRRATKASGVPVATAWRNPLAVQAARELFAGQLLSLAPKALKVLGNMLDDPTTPPAVKRLAASDILDRVGLVSQTALGLSKPLESLSDMPQAELRALVARLETELFARAKPVRELELAPAHPEHIPKGGPLD